MWLQNNDVYEDYVRHYWSSLVVVPRRKRLVTESWASVSIHVALDQWSGGEYPMDTGGNNTNFLHLHSTWEFRVASQKDPPLRFRYRQCLQAI